MTIGIAASGPNAGLAIIRALQAVERVAEGALGGFVSLSAIGADGTVHRAGIQGGGIAALFAAEVPATIACAPHAALMSSGPERPEPLSRFVAADSAVGLVTGHRFPHQPGQDGIPLNEAVLAALRRGVLPAKAVGEVLRANPLADAGVIAMDRAGRMAFGNTALVCRRPDTRTARLPGIMVLLNSISPGRAAAMLAAETAQMTMRPVRTGLTVILRRGIPIEPGPAARLDIGGDRVVSRIVAPTFRAQVERQDFGFGYRVPVWHDGALIGCTLSEPYLVAREDALESVDGHAERKLTLIVPEGAQQKVGNRRTARS